MESWGRPDRGSRSAPLACLLVVACSALAARTAAAQTEPTDTEAVDAEAVDTAVDTEAPLASTVVAEPPEGVEPEPSEGDDDETEATPPSSAPSEPEEDESWRVVIHREPRVRGLHARIGAEVRGRFEAASAWPMVGAGYALASGEVTLGVQDQGWIGARLGVGGGWESTFTGRTELHQPILAGGPMVHISPLIVAGLYLEPVRVHVFAGADVTYGTDLDRWGLWTVTGVGIEVIPAVLEVSLMLSYGQRAVALRADTEPVDGTQLGVLLGVGGFLPLTDRDGDVAPDPEPPSGAEAEP